jgi:O-antigen/teichoic acid export membrane protein
MEKKQWFVIFFFSLFCAIIVALLFYYDSGSQSVWWVPMIAIGLFVGGVIGTLYVVSTYKNRYKTQALSFYYAFVLAVVILVGTIDYFTTSSYTPLHHQIYTIYIGLFTFSIVFDGFLWLTVREIQGFLRDQQMYTHSDEGRRMK